MFSQILSFLKKDFLDSCSYKLSFLSQFFVIFFSALSFFFISKIVPGATVTDYGGDYFSFVLIGIAFSNFLGFGMNEFSKVIRGMQTTGTIEIVLSSRAKLSTVLLGSSIWSYLMTVLRIAVYFIFGIFVFNMKTNVNIGAVLVIFILSTICFSSIGIISAAMILIFKRGTPFEWVFGTLSALLAGTMYPTTIMPLWLQKIAMLLPLTYALRAMRLAFIQGHSLLQLWFDVLMLVVFSAILLPISLIVFKYTLKKSKINGSLIKY